MVVLMLVNLPLNILLIMFSGLYVLSIRETVVQSWIEYIIPTTMFLAGVCSITFTILTVF